AGAPGPPAAPPEASTWPPDRRLIRGAQPPYKLPHRPSQSGSADAERTDDGAEESDVDSAPPPPELSDPKPQERHRHNPPPVSVESQTAPAQLMRCPSPTLRLLPRLRRRQAAGGDLPEEKEASTCGRWASGPLAAGFVQPLVENVINSVTLQQRVPPMASPRSGRVGIAISGGQTLMVSSADAGKPHRSIWRPLRCRKTSLSLKFSIFETKH
uniref:AT-hook motif nuclear-localized protein n=1 Tax=Macrostomum lignano TaxID=282301 RepID=A0A1I8F5J0_9PLAT